MQVNGDQLQVNYSFNVTFHYLQYIAFNNTQYIYVLQYTVHIL